MVKSIINYIFSFFYFFIGILLSLFVTAKKLILRHESKILYYTLLFTWLLYLFGLFFNIKAL